MLHAKELDEKRHFIDEAITETVKKNKKKER